MTSKLDDISLEVQRNLMADNQQRDPVIGTDIVTLEDKDSKSVYKSSVDRLVRGSVAAAWAGNWNAQVDLYYKNQMVRDGDWLMIANKNTVDRAGPQPAGDPFHIYNGTLTDQTAIAKLIFFGARYTVQQNAYLTGYRTYVKTGEHYEIYVVKDPLGTAVSQLVESFVAVTDGWRESNIVLTIVLEGDVFDIVALATEPDPTPTSFNGDWDYLNPQNEGIPLSGQIIHPTKNLQSFNINYIDGALVDRTAELQGLDPGDQIDGAGLIWTIQSSTDNGSFIEFIVSPAQQGSPTGIQDFIFNTVVATPIDYGEDINYWTTQGITNIKGLFIADDSYDNIVPNNNAYGLDVYVQDAIISPDWDLMALSSSVGTGGIPEGTL